jgi:hypothetical protein
MQPDKLRQSHMWQRMSWAQLPTQSGPHAQRPRKVSVTRHVAWSADGNAHNFRAKSGILCLTTRSCATKSAGSYSIADRLACTLLFLDLEGIFSMGGTVFSIAATT